MTDKNLIALADSFMDIFGFKRIATMKDNIITPAALESDSCTKSAKKTDYFRKEWKMSRIRELANTLLTVPNEQCTTVDQWMKASRNAGKAIKVMMTALEFYQGIGKTYEEWLESIKRKGNMVAADAIARAEELAGKYDQ